jgi:hypothetical protein
MFGTKANFLLTFAFPRQSSPPPNFEAVIVDAVSSAIETARDSISFDFDASFLGSPPANVKPSLPSTPIAAQAAAAASAEFSSSEDEDLKIVDAESGSEIDVIIAKIGPTAAEIRRDARKERLQQVCTSFVCRKTDLKPPLCCHCR